MIPNDDVSNEDLSGPVVDRRTTLSLLSAAGITGLAGCTSGSSGGSSGGTERANSQNGNIKTGGRLQAGWLTGSIDVLDPPKIPTAIFFQVTSNIFSGLVTLDKDLKVRGDLARDWEVTNQGKTFTFNLREGVKFHNGTEFTAEDVKYSITRTITQELTAANKLSPLKDPNGDGVVVRDDYTVELNLKQAFAPILIYLTRGPGRAATIVSKEAIQEMGPDQYSTTPVGTGPFRVTEHEVGDHITLDAHGDYFETDENGNQLPYLDGVDIRPIPEAATIVNAVESGDIDFAQEIPRQNASRVEEAPNADKLSAPGVNWTGLCMNAEQEPFTSKEARLGIAKALDQEAYVQDAYFGEGIPDTGPINKATSWVWRDNKPSDQNYNSEKATQLLNKAGIAGANFSILTRQGELRPSKIVRQQLNKVGINAQLEQVTSSTYWDRVYAADFDATIVGSAGDPDPDQSLYNFFRKYNEDGVWNFPRYKDDTVHKLLAEQRKEVEREKRKQTLQEVENNLIADAPWAFLAHENDIAAKRSTVKGFVHIPFMRNFHQVWLDE